MPRKRYSEETRRQVMQEMEQGKAVDEVIRRHGIAEATYYRWRAQFRPIRAYDDAIYRQLEEENRQLRATLLPRAEYHVGTSSEMRQVWALVDKVAQGRTTVLITGESGTGKEVVARAIHAAADRSRELGRAS